MGTKSWVLKDPRETKHLKDANIDGICLYIFAYTIKLYFSKVILFQDNVFLIKLKKYKKIHEFEYDNYNF